MYKVASAELGRSTNKNPFPRNVESFTEQRASDLLFSLQREICLFQEQRSEVVIEVYNEADNVGGSGSEKGTVKTLFHYFIYFKRFIVLDAYVRKVSNIIT